MKLRLALVVSAFMLSLLLGRIYAWKSPGSGEAEAARAQTVIGFSMDTLKEARWQRDRDLFVAAAEALGAKVLVQSANSDDARQMQDVQGLLSNGIDVLVMVPHNGEAMAKAVHLAHEAGVPVMAYDRMINDCDLDLYIAFDNVRIGELQAQFVVDRLPPGRPVRMVRILGAKTDPCSFLYKEGQDNVLKSYLERGEVEIIHEDWAENWKPENAKKITSAAITQHGARFDAILASNDGTAGGAIQALKEEGLAGKILVTGQDAELVACQRLLAGTQAMTIYLPIPRIATTAAELAVKLGRKMPITTRHSSHNGQIEVPAVLLDVVTLTKDNLQETVITDGFYSEQEIYRNAAAQ